MKTLKQILEDEEAKIIRGIFTTNAVEENKNMKNDYRKITVAIMTDIEEPMRVYLDGERYNCSVSKGTIYRKGDAAAQTYSFYVPQSLAPRGRALRRIAIMNIVAFALGLLALALSIIRMMGGAQ